MVAKAKTRIRGHVAVAQEPSDDVVRARINSKVKKEATKVLAEMGLTPSSAYRMLMIRIAKEKALPFNPHVPNATTEAALKAAAAGKVTKSKSLKSLFEDLNADD
jgi:DNA-damage-inducible protein J